MSTHRETGTIEGCSSTEETVQRLLTFYRANGYRVVERQDASGATLERGKPGAGWWTSNMTELHTVVVVQSAPERVELAYEVDTSGQLLKEVERAFWRRELQWARRYANAEDAGEATPGRAIPGEQAADEPRDLRIEEERRAKHQTNDMRSVALWGTTAVFLAILIMGFLGFI